MCSSDLQEIFGVNQVMRDLADGYARQGYVVACPDIFWRQQPGIQITDKTDAEWARAFELFKGFDFALGIEDLVATLAALRDPKKFSPRPLGPVQVKGRAEPVEIFAVA